MSNRKLNDAVKALRPCPFCKSNATIVKLYVKTRRGRVPRGLKYAVGCTDPECILHADDKSARLLFATGSLDVLCRRWNRRRPSW